MTDSQELSHSNALLRETLVWDNHSCMPLRPDDNSFLPQLSRVRESGVDVITLNLGMDITSPEDHLKMLASFRRWVDSNSDEYVVATKFTDIVTARETGKLAIVFDVEGMALLDDGNYDLISPLREQGVIWMLVAYNRNNRAGGGCLDDDPGLSDHGRTILAEMKRAGILACCSHTGHRTAMDVMEWAANPVIFSHSNPATVHAHVRNIPDVLIKACAETGGVVGINGVGDFLGPGENYAEMIAQHIDHVVQLVGPDHAGISLDYLFDEQEVLDFMAKIPESFGDEMAQFSNRFAPPETFAGIVHGLSDRGYGAEAIRKVVGGNWARVASEVWV